MNFRLFFRLCLSVQTSFLLPLLGIPAIAAAPTAPAESVRPSTIEITVVDRDRSASNPLLMARQDDYDADNRSRSRNNNDYDSKNSNNNSNSNSNSNNDSGGGRMSGGRWRR